MSDAQDRETKRNIGTYMALVALLLTAIGLILLVSMVMPQAAGFLAVVFGMVFFITLHYITWGWWMLRMRPEDPEEDEGA